MFGSNLSDAEKKKYKKQGEHLADSFMKALTPSKSSKSKPSPSQHRRTSWDVHH